MDALIIAWSKAFLLTELVEVPIVTFLLRSDERSIVRRAGLAFFASVATHPAVWFIFPRLPLAYTPMVAAAEAWAVVGEAVFYALAFRTVDPWRAAGTSLVANGASFGIGLLIRSLTGWV